MLLAPLFFLSSCAIFPETNVEHLAASAGFKREMVRGDTFLHVAYFNQAPRGAGPLHVYLEGDGSPWIDERWISADPTPRNPLMLSLMALDNAPSVYLGRPCYFGLAETVPCSPRFWTSARYSDSVVTSMQAALKRILDDGHFPDVVLIGHSGGGTLAMLLAERISQTRAVVTIAGNLDTDAWTAFHHYSPLADSLNPARQPPLPRDIYQLHLIGGRDRDVTPALIRPVVARQNSTDLKIIEEYDHVCCWLEMWPEVLATLESHTRSASPRTASAKSRH
jgi:hypothetical protein